MYLKFIKTHYFFKKNPYCIDSYDKRHLSENLTFQNLLRTRKLLPAENSGNILAFKKSKRKLLSLISADSFIIKNYLIYDFRVEISNF